MEIKIVGRILGYLIESLAIITHGVAAQILIEFRIALLSSKLK